MVKQQQLPQARALDPVCTQLRAVAKAATNLVKAPTQQNSQQTWSALSGALAAVACFESARNARR